MVSRYPRFWIALSVVALAIAATSVVALVDTAAARDTGVAFDAGAWSAFASLFVLIAPLFAIAFLVAALMAPGWGARSALGIATLIEAAVFADLALSWLQQR